MSGQHNISYALTLLQGKAFLPGYNNRYPNSRGLLVTPSIFVDLGAVEVADPNGVSASQSINGAGLINGALATDGVATFTTPRAVVAAWTGTAVMTVTGTDEYGQILVESSASGTSMTGKKAFKTITAVFTSAATTSNTIGTGDVLGLPFRTDDKNKITVRFDGADDAATIVVADDAVATATTGDVRGTIDIAGTLDAAKTLGINFMTPYRDTKENAFGVVNFTG